MILLCALTSLEGAHTIYVNEYSNNRSMQILLDGKSTHNFIDEKFAMRLGCKVCPTKVGYASL